MNLVNTKGTLSTVSKAIFGPASVEADTWDMKRHEELDRGEFDKLLAALKSYIGENMDARNCRDYIVRNRERMNYPLFRS